MGASYSDPRGPDATSLMWAFFKGRTRTAPFDVPAVVLPPGTPGDTTPDGGAPVGDPANPADPSSPSSAAAGDSGSSGGCSLTRDRDSSRNVGLGALLALGFALALGARRTRPS
jgi:hypothetical protein